MLEGLETSQTVEHEGAQHEYISKVPKATSSSVTLLPGHLKRINDKKFYSSSCVYIKIHGYKLETAQSYKSLWEKIIGIEISQSWIKETDYQIFTKNKYDEWTCCDNTFDVSVHFCARIMCATVVCVCVGGGASGVI